VARRAETGRLREERDTERAVSKENLKVVRAAFDAYFRGDVPAMLELVDPSVMVTQLPDQPDPQTFHGREGLLRAMAEWIGEWDDYSFEVRGMRDFGDRVLVSGVQRGRGQGSGIQVEADVYFVFTLRRGKLVRWQMFQSELQALDAARSG
jgi:ketosteroid isomerase-like protein